MNDYVTLSCSPIDEPCVQVGWRDYVRWAYVECGTFRRQLEEEFKPKNIKLRIKRFYHDFGPYYEVVAYYKDDEGLREASNIQSNLPMNWSPESEQDLKDIGYFDYCVKQVQKGS